MSLNHIGSVGALFCFLFVSVLVFSSRAANQMPLVPMILTSDAFANNMRIPDDYTGEGANMSPPLSWRNIPRETKSFMLICYDPDAQGGDWIHWVVYNIPATIRAFDSNVDVQKLGAKAGLNSFGKNGYVGPRPPVNQGMHHYIFTLFALNDMVSIKPISIDVNGQKKQGVTREMLATATLGNVLAEARLVGLFERKN